MNVTKKYAVADLKRIKALEVTKAYAQHKMRLTGDLDSEFDNWAINIANCIESEKVKIGESRV